MRIAGIIILFGAACLLIVGTVTRSWFEQTTEIESTSSTFLGMFDDDSREKIETNFGLWSVETCRGEGFFGRQCTVETYDPPKHAGGNDEFFSVAAITLIFGVLTSIFLCITSFFLIGDRKSTRVLTTLASIASLIALLLGLAVLVLKPKFLSAEDATIGASVYQFFLGGIGGVVGGLCGSRAMLSRLTTRVPDAVVAASALVDPESMLPLSLLNPAEPGKPRAPMHTPVSFPAVDPPSPACPQCATIAEWAHEYRRYYCPSCRTWV